ncbi:NAD-dependent epimerase/dehydratase family protein [Oribacterium asaccharolyticum]|uniref:NAD-dependent epimerase/dehydratase family protein n=1 Tax=Oribacterium asaccharolyticum TaxID=1501332 RepID=UPI0028E75031|nr:NAD(P)-dependent oxidoreductase [Oribacterium asaccharolyticum]
MRLSTIEQEELTKYIETHSFDRDFKGKTILLTGAKGLVGTAITKWILLQNEIKKTDTVLYASTRDPEQVPDYIEAGDQIHYIPHGKEAEYCKAPDYILHAASPTGNQYHMQYPLETFRTNVDGMERLLDLCSQKKDTVLLYLSSEEVYGLPKDDAPLVTEETVGAIDSLHLRSCYPLGKKACEFLCHAAAKEYHLNTRIIRPTVIHGLFQRYEEPRVVNEILRCIVENKDLHMKSDGLTKKCMLYSLDAISAIFTVLLKGENGEAYNASNPDTFLTVRDLADRVFQKFNPSIKIVFENAAKQSDGFLPHRSIVQDCTKLKALGWEPKADLEHIYHVDIARFKK